jgi:hypothetical protein
MRWLTPPSKAARRSTTGRMCTVCQAERTLGLRQATASLPPEQSWLRLTHQSMTWSRFTRSKRHIGPSWWVPRMKRGSVPQILLWDTPDPYHYVRLQSANGHDLLIVGGEDHKTGQANDADERFRRLWRTTHPPCAGRSSSTMHSRSLWPLQRGPSASATECR